jgi:hypothetical protein
MHRSFFAVTPAAPNPQNAVMLDSYIDGSPDFRFGIVGFMRLLTLALLCFSASIVACAQTPQQPEPIDNGPTILSRSEMEVPPEVATGRGGDYFNFFAFGDFTYNSYEPFNPGAGTGFEGYDAGLGLDLLHYYRSGVVSLDYTGGYRGYPGFNSDPVNNIIQNLSLAWNAQLSRHVLFTVRELAGWNPGGWIPQVVITPEFALGLNLIAIRNESSLTSAGLSIQQTRRLSWQLGGDFYELRFVPSSNNIGSYSEDATAGINYRVSKRTTIGANALYQHFSFLQSRGTTSTQGGFASLQHSFGPRIELGVSGGAMRTSYDESSAQVFGIVLPVSNPRPTLVPFASARLSIARRHTTFSLSGGETVSPGNGVFLTSRLIYAGAGFSYVATRRWSFSAGGGYQRYISIAGGPSAPDGYVSGSTDYKVDRHFGIRASASYTRFDTITVYPGNQFYNLSIGVIFTTADRPVASIF